MNLSAFLYLLCSVVMFLMANYIFYNDRKEPANRTFIVLCLISSFLTLCKSMAVMFYGYSQAELWMKFNFIWPAVIILFFVFTMQFTEKYNIVKNKIVIAFVHLSGTVFIILEFINAMIRPFDIRAIYLLKTCGMVWSVLITAAFMTLIAVYVFSVKDARKKKQASHVLAAISLGILTWIFEYGIAPALGIEIFNLTVFVLLIMLAFLTYTITKCRLFSFNTYQTGDRIINIIPEAIVMTDTDGIIMNCNNAVVKMLGFSEGQLTGKNIGMLFYDDKYIKGVFLPQVLSEKIFTGNAEVQCKSLNGKSVDVLLMTSLIRDEFSLVKGVVFVFVDITERKKLENRLKGSLTKMTDLNMFMDDGREKLQQDYEKIKDMDRIKGNFLSMVSHELRTPLTSIKGFISFFLGGATGPINDTQKEYLIIMKNNTDRLLKLINELLDVSRIESGTFSVNRRNFDVVALLKGCIREITSIARDRRVTIEEEQEFESCIISIDEYRISQAIINILGNSLKFASEGSAITVGIKRCSLSKMKIPSYVDISKLNSAEYIVIYIKDHGIGIDADNITKLFDRFYQVEDINTRKHQGVGLGLAITMEIVLAHDGTVWAESEGRDKGSVFYIILPAA